MALTTAELYETEVIGVVAPGYSSPIGRRPYAVRRLWLPVRRGILFFLLGNIRFFLHLLFKRRWDAVIANDLAILPGCWLAAFLRRKALLLDSRELFTWTPFLIHRPFRRKVWEAAERLLYPRVRYIATVSPPIAKYYEERYKRPIWLIYNLPLRRRGFVQPRLESKLLLYQGLLHPYRGLEELILALTYVEEWKLWIVGDGPQRPYLEKLVSQQRLSRRVQFFGMVPFEALEEYTQRATFGISGEIPKGLNHQYALPNKVFDYLQLGIPVLVGEAPLIQRLVLHYHCGAVVEEWKPRSIAQALVAVDGDNGTYNRWVEGARQAARDLHWERQAECVRAWLRYALAGEHLPPQNSAPPCENVARITAIFSQWEYR